MSLIGFRLGPNKVSLIGLLQPIADALKLGNKSVNSLGSLTLFFYYLSSFLILLISLFLFSCINNVTSFINFKYRFIFIFLILAFNSFNSIFSGWRSYSKFSLIGSIRSVAQLISYEVVLYLCIFFFVLIYSSFDIRRIIFLPLNYSFFFLISCFYFWIPTILAELNRTPFDFSEGESELVRGFNTEFSSSCFTFIFLAEYSNIIFFSILSSFVFFYPIYIYIFFFFGLFGFVLSYLVFVLIS